MSDYAYGQLVLYRPGDEPGRFARIIRRLVNYNAEHPTESWEANGRPYLIVLAGGESVPATADTLVPVADDGSIPVDTTRFGDTPATARDWLVALRERLVASDEWGTTVGATRTPHYWGIQDIVTTVTHSYDDPYASAEGIRITDSLDVDPEPYLPSELVEHIYETEHPTNYGPGFDQTLADAIEDQLQQRGITDIRVTEVTDGDDVSITITNATGGELTDAQQDTLGRILHTVLDDARSLDDYEFTACERVFGIRENLLFLTREDAEHYLALNRHHHSRYAHPYLMTAWRDATVERLWRLLRDVDWSRSTLTMRADRKLMPDLD